MRQLKAFFCKLNDYFIQIYSFLSISHVQINNESALDFYKRFGFEIVETVENYYKRIEPADAYVLEKKLVLSQIETKQQ